MSEKTAVNDHLGTTVPQTEDSQPPATNTAYQDPSNCYIDAEKCTCEECNTRRKTVKQHVWITAEKDEDPCKNRRRTLVLCFDGTGDEFDHDNSNVVQLLEALRKDDHSRQLVYYQAGLGTSSNPVTNPVVPSHLARIWDMMVAKSLSSHVRDGYAFLMQNYTAGDKICMFGFSRGAYTARALAGMLHKVGLLPSGNFQQIPFAYKMYEGDDMDLIKYYKRANCREVDIDFLGVWDTVASVGLLPQYLPHVHDNDAILQLRHAIALDEHRVKFIPQFCVDPKPENLKEKKAKEETPFKVSDHIAESPQTMFPPVNSPTKESTKREEERRRIREIKEVWFTGVHCDVGGGAVKNKETVKLSGISLRWMIRECFECNTRIVFDAKALRKIGLPVCIPRESPDGKPILEPLYQMSRSDYVAQEITAQEKSVLENFDLHDLPHDYERKRDLHDAMADIHDRLKISPVWYLLEWLPWYVKKEKATVNPALTGWGSYKWTWNRGKGRKIVKREIEEGWLVHRTVLLRLYADENYAPKVRPNITAAKASRKNPTKKTKRLRALTREEWISGNNLYKHKQRAWEWVPSLKAESEKYKE